MSENRIDISNKNFSYILAIAECGTISAAAEKLYISQPALSRFVKNLERRIDLSLFDRIDNRLILTDAGHRYIDCARQISAAEQSMVKEIKRIQNENKKYIRIGIPDHWAAYIIPLLVVSIQNVLPNIHLEIVDVNSRTLEDLLLQAEVDMIISRFPSTQSAIKSSLLHEDRVYLAVPDTLAGSLCTEGYDSAGIPYIHLSELKKLTYILPNPGQSIRKCVDALFCDLKIVPDIKMLCRSVEASMRMAGSGVGCCFVSSTHRQHIDILHPPRYFAIDHPAAMLPLHISYLSGRVLPKHMAQFISHISTVL